MVWYKPSTWFNNELPKDIYCCYSHCLKKIDEETVAYSKKLKHVYHNNTDCKLGSLLPISEPQNVEARSLEYINLEEAKKIVKSRKVIQPTIEELAA